TESLSIKFGENLSFNRVTSCNSFPGVAGWLWLAKPWHFFTFRMGQLREDFPNFGVTIDVSGQELTFDGHEEKSYKFFHVRPLLPWPTYSPDMSPIEHVWHALDRRIRQCVPVPTSIQELCTAIEEEWDNIPQATINNLINSMQRRCVELHEANGGHARY
ncbi:hypothetical protein ANANG_G00147140, partial [Anguilla anguilla]